MTCVHVNPNLNQFWIIDFRIYDPDSDGKTKLDHVHDMLTNCVYQKRLLFRTVLVDTWYATNDAILYIEQLGTAYYRPLKAIVKWMTQVVLRPIARWTRRSGLKESASMAKWPRSRAFPKTTR